MPRNAINESIALINYSSNIDLKSGLEIEAKRFSDLFDTDETLEGLTAFVQKRPPNFSKCLKISIQKRVEI